MDYFNLHEVEGEQMYRLTIECWVGKEVEIKESNEQKFALVSVAVPMDYKVNGEWIKQEPDWNTVLMSFKQYEHHKKKLKVGSKLLVTGIRKLRTKEVDKKVYKNWHIEPSTIHLIQVNKVLKPKENETGTGEYFTAEDIPF